MAGTAELFTVCSHCGQQVSAFVTECPYCGTRLRKRAPRLDRKDGNLEALRQDVDEDEAQAALEEAHVVELPVARRSGIRARLRSRRPTSKRTGGRPTGRRRSTRPPEPGRPWATLLLIGLSLASLPVQQFFVASDLLLGGSAESTPIWRPLVAALTYFDTWQALAVLTTLGVFGWLWERRCGPLLGPLVVLGTFLVAGVGGLLVAATADAEAFQSGAGGAAVALATAWIVAELRARNRREALDGDLLGASVLLAVPVATSIVTTAGAPVATIVGLLLGAVLGLMLDAMRR